jgi:hypothetical protein
MSYSEHVKSQQLLIEWLGKCEHLTGEKWLLAVVYGSPQAADNDLAEIIWSYYDRGMIAGAAEIKRLREERDEARRELCIGLADHTHCTFDLPDGCWNHLKVQHARGWDCFKEDQA